MTAKFARLIAPAAAGAVVGGILGAAFDRAFQVASGWWGAGTPTLELLVDGPLGAVRFWTFILWKWPASTVWHTALLYAGLTLLVWRAADGPRMRVAATGAYALFVVGAAVGAAVYFGRPIFYGSPLDYLVRNEARAVGRLARMIPGVIVTIGGVTAAWHLFAIVRLVSAWAGQRPAS